MRTRTVVGIALAVVVLVLGGSWLQRDHDGAEPDEAAWAAGAPSSSSVPRHRVTVAREDQTTEAAMLDVSSGVDVVTVRTDDRTAPEDVLVAWTPEDSAVAPAVLGSDGHYVVTLAGTGLAGAKVLEVLVAPDVTWTVRLSGGAEQETVDLRGGRLSGLDLVAGSSTITLLLAAPDGEVRVRMAGGASLFDVQAPAAVPVEVRLVGGAGSATIDGTTTAGVAGGTVLTPPDFAGAVDRYVVDTTAGVSAFTLTRG